MTAKQNANQDKVKPFFQAQRRQEEVKVDGSKDCSVGGVKHKDFDDRSEASNATASSSSRREER